MKIAPPLQVFATAALLAACGPAQLIAVPDNPYSNDETDVVQRGPLTLVASPNSWYERALSQVSTPVEVMIVNRGKQTVPIKLEDLELVDEQGRVYRALPAQAVASRLFGGSPPPPESYLEPVPVPPAAEPPGPSQEPPSQEPPAPPSTGVQAPSGGPSQTLAPSLAPGIVLVAGHSGGGGHGGGGGRGGAVGGQRFGGGGRGFYGPRGYGYGYGFRGGRFGYPYRGYGAFGWGAPYWGWGGWGWGWGFGPAYVVGLDVDDYYYPGYDPRELDHLGPWQVYQVALRATDLKPNQRMGGLVFFEPAWNARYLTLRLAAHPEGAAPLELQARFDVR